MIGCESWDVPCDVFGVCITGTEWTARELDPTVRAGSLIGSEEPVTRRDLAEFPFAPLMVEGGGGEILRAISGIVDK
jgi:hypothetical protein